MELGADQLYTRCKAQAGDPSPAETEFCRPSRRSLDSLRNIWEYILLFAIMGDVAELFGCGQIGSGSL